MILKTNFIHGYEESDAIKFLKLLIYGDLFFIILHIINTYTLDTSLFDITADRKLPEIYQYVKFISICFLLKHAASKFNCKLLYSWILFFTYLLLDDSLRIHEKIGKFIDNSIEFEPFLGLSTHRITEVSVSVIAGSILFFPLLWAYLKGSPSFRAISHRFAFLIGVLVWFGVVIDVAGGLMIKTNSDLLLELVEDGGEMISVSVITWYACRIATRNENSAPALLG